jgi:hypothetical protein
MGGLSLSVSPVRTHSATAERWNFHSGSTGWADKPLRWRQRLSAGHHFSERAGSLEAVKQTIQ